MNSVSLANGDGGGGNGGADKEDGGHMTNGLSQHHHWEEEEKLSGPKFDPPVYLQRYRFVKKILTEHSVESVVDFGSAECKIFRWLKDISTLRRVFLVDVDLTALQSGLWAVRPLNFEYLIQRLTPLTVSVLHGSAARLDGRIVGCQAATLVEIIEHLQPEMLKQVTHCVFGQLRPPLVIVTTPNSDFNVLFPNFTGFRHWDHKFEWTREEFQAWCSAVCKSYGYSVSYAGIGEPPSEMEHVGCCSQAAIFTETLGKPGQQTDEEVYSMVQQVTYPWDQRTPLQRLEAQVQYAVNTPLLIRGRCGMEEGEEAAMIPLPDLVSFVLNHSKEDEITEAQVIEHIQKMYRLSEDGSCLIVQDTEEVESSSDDSCFNKDMDDLDERFDIDLDTQHKAKVEENWE